MKARWTIILLLVILCVTAWALPVAADQIIADEATAASEVEEPTADEPTAPELPAESSTEDLTPVLIVTYYDYGGTPAVAGQNFNLTFTLFNTSKSLTVRNVTVKINGGESFALNGEADTFYLSKINANTGAGHTARLTSSVELAEGAYPVNIAASYEYYDSNGAKQTGSSELNLTVPVTQSKRVTITRAMINAPEIMAGSEYNLSYTFVNNSFGKLLNTQVSVVDTDSGETLASAYLGSIEPSSETSGSSNLTLFFDRAGSRNLKFVVSYEDSKMNALSTEQEFTAEVIDYVEPVWEEEMPEEEVSGVSPLLILGIVIVVLAAGAVVTVKLVRKRRAKKLESELLEDDDDEAI